MPKLIESTARIEPAGTRPKPIDGYFGRVNSGEEGAEYVAVCLSFRPKAPAATRNGFG